MTHAKLVSDTHAAVFTRQGFVSAPSAAMLLAGTAICGLHHRPDEGKWLAMAKADGGDWQTVAFDALPETHGGDATRDFHSLTASERDALPFAHRSAPAPELTPGACRVGGYRR